MINQEMSNVRIWVTAAEKSADFSLTINVVNDSGVPIATIGSCGHMEGEKLHQILHAFRMGQRYNNKS